MSSSILAENERRRLTLPLPWLFCFAMFTAWQIGVVSLSGDALSVHGRTPLGIDSGNLTPVFAVGYIFSIAYMLIFPKRIVWAERVTAGAALLSALALYLPFSPETQTVLFIFQLLCCCFMIGFETALIVALFNDKTAIKHLLVAYGIVFILVAFLQNDFYITPFWVFKIFNVAALTLQLLFYGRLPSNVWPEYTKRGSGLVCPRGLFAGLFGLCFLGNILISFGMSAAEGVKHGMFVFDVSFAVFAITGYFFLRWFHISPLRYASIAVVVSVVGFILIIVSQYIPALALPACVLLGVGVTDNILIPYYGLVMTKRYPSRFISPVIIGISLVASVVILSALIEAFRENTAFLYILYLAIAVVTAALYLLLEPYLLYSFRSRPLISDEEISGLARTGDADDQALRPAEAENAGPSLTPPPVRAPLETERQQNLIDCSFDNLTARELAVAEMLMQGFKYKDICGRLNIKKNTVYWYRRQLFDKLQISTIHELFILAEKHERTRE
ncbi:MAG: helix-turn-helix transcriptional regulator [Treponema sp.]|jgi:DNA-binding CsgD family transcriptional regulator|nr:helix-turn-helix transcriptional regulator [Treponema sp.]